MGTGKIHHLPQFHTPPAERKHFHESGKAHQWECRGREKVGEDLQQHAAGAAHIQQDERTPQAADTIGVRPRQDRHQREATPRIIMLMNPTV